MNFGAKPAQVAKGARDDRLLVQECLLGSEEAWAELIDKYKNLIYSIPLRYGFSADDSAEIFQTVSLAMLRDLPQLREPRALAAWLIKLTARTCVRARHESRRYTDAEIGEEDLAEKENLPEGLFRAVEQEQILREALTRLTADCRRLVELLFLTDPPMPYEAAARTLGLSTGSIGATRMRCLDKLRSYLEKKGFR